MSDETKTCERPGCGKKLRSSNTKGVCGSGCLSDEAPPSQRAKGAGTPRREGKRAAAPESAGSSGALERFRQVAAGLGLDPDAQLEAFAETWLAEVRSKVEDGA